MAGAYHSLYNLTTTLVSFPLLPLLSVYFLLKPNHAKGLGMRLGNAPNELKTRGRQDRVWIHASSVGEVNVAEAIINALSAERNISFALSTFTWDGYEHARRRLGDRACALILPIDVEWCVRRALRAARPKVFVTVETELWPNFLWAAREMGVRTMLANGRLSPRTVKGFSRFKPFFREVFQAVDVISMAGARQAERAVSLGAPVERVTVCSNAKFGLLVERVQKTRDERDAMRKRLSLETETAVFVAGSVRSGEESFVAEACEKLIHHAPGAVALVAPRHIERISLFEAALRRAGLRAQKWSAIKRGDEPRAAQVVLVDTLGDLFVMYGLATAAFCGASLTPRGGQNIMEPAAWGVAPLHGPYMEDFADAADTLARSDAAVRVNNGNELIEKLLWLIDNRDARENMGARALKVAQSHAGAADETARLIMNLLRSAQ